MQFLRAAFIFAPLHIGYAVRTPKKDNQNLRFMKRLTLIAFFFFSLSTAFSQSFMHGAGVNIFVAKAGSGSANLFGGFHYSPRFNFLETESFSLSLGLPISAGFSGSYSVNYNSYYGTEEDNSLQYMFNAPLILNFNVGAGSSKETESRFGFFAGGGYGFHAGSFNVMKTEEYGGGGGSYEYEVNESGTTHGPAANAGIRIAVGESGRNIEVILKYMKGISGPKPSIFGAGCTFNF